MSTTTRPVLFAAIPAILCAIGVPLGGAALAYDSPGPKAPVPEHSCPWVETKRPDIHTVFLWKFLSEADRQAGASSALKKGNPDALLQGDEGGAGLAGTRDMPASEPKLGGDARAAAGIGRFGGGLVLGGAGYAEGLAALSALLGRDGGFTLDFWFRKSNTASPSGPKDGRILLAVPDNSGKPLVSAAWSGATSVVFAVAGTERLRVPVRETADGWHHFALVVDAPRGQPDSATLSLTVDGATAKAGRPDPFRPIPWFRGIPARLRSKLLIGGAPGQPGLQGVVDEVRLTKGVKYLYPWTVGAQERTRRREDLELRPPFFRGGRVLTRFRFDGDLKPDAFAGLSWKGRTKAARFRPGIQGQALDLSGVDQTGFAMKGFYILPEKEGTVEFWFRPLDWHNFYVGEYDGRDVQAQWLMTLTAKDALYATPSKNIEVMRGRACRDMKLRWQPIHPGTWTHVLLSVKDGGPTVYVNGQPQKLWQAGLVIRGHPHSTEPLKKWRERTGGKDVDDTWTLAFVPSHTLIDEFSVYSSAMTPEEAWNAYARWLPDAAAQMKPLPAFRVTFDYFAHSWDRQEKLEIRLACLTVGNTRPASADLELRDEKGEVLLRAEKQRLDGSGSAVFALKRALPFGRYPVVVRSRGADGAVLKEEKQEYVREKPAWLGNTLGKERTVPKPWAPIAVDGRKLRVVGREIELGANGLPSRIETLKQPVLAAPVTVRVGKVELAGRGPVFTETAPDRVAWKTALAGAGLTADLDAWMEFDGLLYCAITLKPAAGAEATVEDLDVDFPMAANRATQLLANGGGNDFRASWTAKSVPGGAGRVWNSLDKPYPAFTRADGLKNYMPDIWIGGDERGLYFGGENDQGWTVNANTPAQEIVRDKETVTFRMNVIREPTTITTAGHRIHFVILPTPAKPEPPDWRRQMLSGGVNFGSCDTFGGFDMKTDPSDPNPGDAFRLEPRSWEHAKKMAPQCRAKWGRCILYADAAHPAPGPAFRDWNHDLWAGTGRLAWTPECEDYAVWAINEFLRRGLIDGVYWDDVSVGYTYSLASTAYKYAGSKNGRRVGFTALAQRRVNMRLWRLFEAAGKEPCIWAHMTVCYEVPIFSFCRYLSNCEFVTGVVPPGTRDAMDMWSPDTLRILGGSAKWGTGYHNLSVLPRALANTAAAKQWLYPQARTETGLYLTSDQMGPADGLGRVLVREKPFDGPVRAYPWWRAAEVLKVTALADAQALTGVYVLAGRAIVMVANRDRAVERDFSLELDAAKVFPGAAGVTWRDLDPGLKPPAAVVASAKEIKAAGVSVGEPAREDQARDATALTDLVRGTTPQGRALGRLELRVEGNKARVVVRPRDYRVLEAKPRQ